MKGEREFHAEAARLKRSPGGRRIVHVFSSWAMAQPDFAARMAEAGRAIAGALESAAGGDAYSLANGDLVVVVSQLSSPQILRLCVAIEKILFAGITPRRNPYGEIGFHKRLEAARDLGRLLDAVAARAVVPSADAQPKEAAGPAECLEIAERLKRADIRPLVFNQPVYGVDRGQQSIEFLEFHVALAKLEELLCPGSAPTRGPSTSSSGPSTLRS